MAGQVSAVSIANSGSGYRAGIQTVVNVGVQTDGEPSLQFIGTTAISGGHIVSVAITNPGTGYTSTNPPELVFDDPHSYDNIPVQYSSSGPTGLVRVQPSTSSLVKVLVLLTLNSDIVDMHMVKVKY